MLMVNAANLAHDFWFTSFLKPVMVRTHSVSPAENRGKGEEWKHNHPPSLMWKQKYSGMAIPQKWKIELPCDPVISLLSIYPKELKAGTRTGICTLIFIAALFTIVKIWKQLKCPSTDKQNVVYPSMGYHSTLKGRKFWHVLQHRWAWRTLY